MSDKNVGNLVEEAEKRKQKLANLKNKRMNKDTDKENNKEKIPIFRNYAPIDTELQNGMLPQLKPSEVDEKIKDQISLNTHHEKLTSKIEMNLTTLAPRKIDWDLKRDISERLEKLEKKTEKAIAELIRERLLKTQDFSSLPDMDPAPLNSEKKEAMEET